MLLLQPARPPRPAISVQRQRLVAAVLCDKASGRWRHQVIKRATTIVQQDVQLLKLIQQNVITGSLCLLSALPCLSLAQETTLNTTTGTPSGSLNATTPQNANTVLAQVLAQASDSTDPVILAPVDVVATTSTQTGDVQISEYTGHHTRIEGPALSNDATTLAETIAHETGVQSTQAGAEGSWSTISIRGSTSAQTAVYLDGVLLNNASNGSVDLASLSLLDIDSIDLFRGETPVQLGFGGLGGAINLQTPKSVGTKTRLLLGAGSFNARRAQVSHQQQLGRVAISANLSHQQSDNDFSYSNDNGTPLNVTDDRQERRRNAQFERTGLLLKAGYQHSDTVRYDGSLQYSGRLQGVPHWRNFAGTLSTFDTDALQVQLNQRRESVVQSNWNLVSGVYLTRNTEEFDDRLSQIGLGSQYTRTGVDVVGLRSYQEHIGDNGTLAINHDLRQETLQQEDRIGSENFRTQRRQLTGALQYSWFSNNEAWLVTPAFRYSVLRDRYDNASVNGNSRYDATRFAPQIGLKWQRSAHTALTANLGKHFREPVFFELFGDRGLFRGNDNLTAEEGINADVGVAWLHPDKQRSFRLSLFRNSRDNLIARVFDSQGVGRAENIGDALITGVEANAQWRPTQQLGFTVNATLLSPRNLSRQAAFSGKTLPGQAKTTAYARVDYQQQRWRWWYSADLIYDRFFDEANLLVAEDQLIHSTGLSWNYQRLSASLLLHNLGNDNAEDINGYPKPGRSVQFNVSYSLDRDPS